MPEIKSFDGVSGFKMNDKKVSISVNARVNNPNKKKVSIEKLITKIIVNEKMLATVYANDKVVLEKTSHKDVSIPLEIELEPGAIFRIGMLALKDSADFIFKGSARGGLGILRKRIRFKIDQRLPTNQLKLP
jgi:hypothetical protein